MGAPPKELVERLRELLAIRSVVGEEAEIANDVEAKLRARLSDVRRIGNAVVAFGPARGRPRVAFAGHLDTVAAAPDDANPPRIVGDRIAGLGASDMKSAIACDLWVLESLDLAKCPYDLAWVYYDREEGPLEENGLRPLFDAVPELAKLDLAICGEPTDNAVQLGCVGSLHARVVFAGKAAHSARPWQGKNAIHEGARFLGALAARPVREVTLDGLLYREVVAATLAAGGRSRNVVPDRFEINVNARFSAATDPKNIEAEIRAQAAGAEVTIVDLAPAAPPNRKHPLIDRLVGIAGAPAEPKQAWTDVAQFALHGVPALNFGPGEQAQAHQRGESVSLASLARGAELRRAFLK